VQRGCIALAVLALAALAPGPARGDDDRAVELTAVLHARFTDLERPPRSAILFDPAARTFALDSYLVPRGADRYASTFAALALDGSARGGDLHWRVAVDTGELRRRRFPLLADVCASTGATGLDLAGSGACTGSSLYTLEETLVGAPEWTANGRPFRVEAEKTFLVREAYVAYELGRAGFLTARAGRKRIAVADGLVHDDYATGVELDADLGAIGPPFELDLALFQPTRDLPPTPGDISPMLVVRADWLPSLFERAGLFLAVLRDRTGSVGEAERGAIVEQSVVALTQAQLDPAQRRSAARILAASLAAPYRSDATLGWLGTSGSLVPGHGQRLEWTAALVGGTLQRVSTRAGGSDVVLAEDVSIRGEAVSLRHEIDLGPRVTLGSFLLFLSGGTMPTTARAGAAPATGTYGGFVGVAPFITATNVFFGGGLSEAFAARQSTTPGVNGRGVLAPGAWLAWDPTEEVGLEARAAWLRADAVGPYGGRVYGTELDLVATWTPRPWLVLGAEADALWPGSFYGGSATVYKTILAVDVLTP
jgi:hypothetical protein